MVNKFGEWWLGLSNFCDWRDGDLYVEVDEAGGRFAGMELSGMGWI